MIYHSSTQSCFLVNEIGGAVTESNTSNEKGRISPPRIPLEKLKDLSRSEYYYDLRDEIKKPKKLQQEQEFQNQVIIVKDVQHLFKQFILLSSLFLLFPLSTIYYIISTMIIFLQVKKSFVWAARRYWMDPQNSEESTDW